MHGLLIIISGLVVIPFLFPEEVVHWLQTIHAWLEERRARQDQEIARLEAVAAAHSEWANWTAKLRRQLVKSSRGNDRSLLLLQALAAGERYLQGIDRHAFPQLFAKTEQLCQRLRSQLASQAQQKRDQAANLTPKHAL